MSWSNVRKGKQRAAEYHLYYSSTTITANMEPGDALFLALCKDGTLLAIIINSETIENQLIWLFGIDNQLSDDFTFKGFEKEGAISLDFTARYILNQIGVEAEESDAELLDRIIEPFGLTFPSTKLLSQTARDSLPDVSLADDPDEALLAWVDREEQLFRRLERRVVEDRLRKGFVIEGKVDDNGFHAFSLSVQNRRKARAGQALENHLEEIIRANNLKYVRGAETENKNKPDFFFPGIVEYHNPDYHSCLLTMLGVKSTLKDRWRQILSEADRIEEKHLLTLEPGISESQTRDMQAKKVQLVLPRRLHATFRPSQKAGLMSVREFLALVRSRQPE